MRLLACAVLLVGCLAQADALSDARQQVAALDFKAARKSLEAAQHLPNLDHAQVLELHELTGIVAGTLSDAKGAREAFARLLNLDPSHKLPGKHTPRVTTPFFEAKGRVAEEGALTLDVTPPSLAPGAASPLVVAVHGDFFSRVKSLRAGLRVDSSEWSTVSAVGTTLTAPAAGKRFAYYLEALDEAGWVLAVVGSREAPLVVEAPPAPPVAPPLPPPGPTAREQDDEAMRHAAVNLLSAAGEALGGRSTRFRDTTSINLDPRTSRLLTGGLVLTMGLGCLGLSTWQGVIWFQARQNANAANANGSDQGPSWDKTANDAMVPAIGLGVVGLALTGVGVAILFSSDTPKVAIVPVAGGGVFTWSGALP